MDCGKTPTPNLLCRLFTDEAVRILAQPGKEKKYVFPKADTRVIIRYLKEIKKGNSIEVADVGLF